MKSEEKQKLDRIFSPRGMAVFGGVKTNGSFGQLNLLTQMSYGYKGKLYPIHPKGGEVAGLRVYRNLNEVEGPVDLASISVPAKVVPQVLRDCLENGVTGAEIHTSGFEETGELEGIALQEEINQIAKQGIRIVGPNCFGIYCPRGGITIMPGAEFSKESGPVAMICQSGGVAADFGYESEMVDLGVSKVISFGNGCDLGAVELLEYLAEDPETDYITAYLEGVKDGGRFLDIVKSVTPKKPVIVWKGGLTPLGGKATQSHTGSLGGEADIWNGALTQAGAVAVQGMDEITDTLMALAYLKNSGKRIALMGGGGAIGVFSSDLVYRYGLEMPPFSPETQKLLKKWFPTPGNSVVNPLDTGTPVLPLETVEGLAREVLNREPLDVLVIILLLRSFEVVSRIFMESGGIKPPPRGSYLQGVLEVMSRLKDETGKDVVAVFENRAHRVEHVEVESVSRSMRKKYLSKGIPVYPNVERALRGIKNAWQGRCH